MTEDPLRKAIGERLKSALESKRISKARAARELGVSRQMLYEYLNGKSLPNHRVLQRACSLFGLEINYGNFMINVKSFREPISNRDIPSPVQLDLGLQKAIEQLCDEDLQVNIIKKENGRIELQVSLRLGSAS